MVRGVVAVRRATATGPSSAQPPVGPNPEGVARIVSRGETVSTAAIVVATARAAVVFTPVPAAAAAVARAVSASVR